MDKSLIARIRQILNSIKSDFRLDKLLNFDPRARHTLWNQVINGMLAATIEYGTNQVSVQRAMSLRSSTQIIRFVAKIT